MPIYDYRCAACRKRFAVFFRSFSEIGPVRCQHCGSDDVAKLAPRVAQLVGEDARFDRLSDPSALGDVDENDPASVARWAKRLGREMGEDLGDEFDEAMAEIAGSGTGEGSEPDPQPYAGGTSNDD
ncbi:MAG: zinc ribbon domain-containing protein [Chloroflexi bacterium]|nr:zinc ribbon domain-containing protein [Chloroflexota bacterium]